jgi:peptidoglycan/xylan/chitin deacetylase (PgdA/CDA1 family)
MAPRYHFHSALVLLALATFLTMPVPLQAEKPIPKAIPVSVEAKPEPGPIMEIAPETTPAAITPAADEEPISVTSVLVSGPYIAMTFDDGPHGVNTPKLLKMLRDRNIKATFFVIGECAAEHPDVLAQIDADGHEIGNHSWSHPNLAKCSEQRVREQLQKTDDVIYQVTNKRCTLLRPPYGAFSEAQKRWAKKEFGYTTVLWSVDPLDWKRPGASVVANRIVSRTGNGSIVLAHDIHTGTVASMPSTLDQLLAKGYKFVTVSELLKLRVPKTVPIANSITDASESTVLQSKKVTQAVQH